MYLFFFFFFNDTATTEIYTLSLHDALPIFGGLFAGFGGLALTALVRSTNASTSTQYALIAIAAVVLGGTSLAGGRGGLIGVAFGAFTIYLFQNLLSTFEVNPAWLQIVYGAILIVAVVIQGALVPEAG